VVQRCKESIKELVLVLFHAGGCVLIAGCSKNVISHNETYAEIGVIPTGREYKVQL
jgi:hypothetical protein